MAARLFAVLPATTLAIDFCGYFEDTAVSCEWVDWRAMSPEDFLSKASFEDRDAVTTFTPFFVGFCQHFTCDLVAL